LVLKKEKYKRIIKILIPISNFVDREMLIDALNIFKSLGDISITLFNIVEVSSTTLPINSFLFKREISNERSRIQRLVDWLISQNFNVNLKVSIARSSAEGIIEEANSEGYSFIIMMKRKFRGRFQKLFHKSITEDVIRNTRCMVLTFLIDEKRTLRL
jgi:nucleotide-binding universal stress UspA family protein